MKRKNLWNRLLALSLAGCLVAGNSVVTVSAEETAGEEQLEIIQPETVQSEEEEDLEKNEEPQVPELYADENFEELESFDKVPVDYVHTDHSRDESVMFSAVLDDGDQGDEQQTDEQIRDEQTIDEQSDISQVPEGYVIPDLEDWKHTVNEDGTVTMWHYIGTNEKVYVPAYYGEYRVIMEREYSDPEDSSSWIGVFENEPVTGVWFDPEIEGSDFIGMFSNCQQLEEVGTIPDDVTDMTQTFYGCKSLISVPKMPDSVNNLYATFLNCISLQEVPNFPASVTEMKYTCRGCRSLMEVPALPDTVTNMYGAFYGCSNLTKAPEVRKISIYPGKHVAYKEVSLLDVPRIAPCPEI